MSEIILNDEQAKIIRSAHDDVLVRDPLGNVIARMARIPSNAEREESALIAEARRRLASDQPRHTTQEVLERLESLEKK